MDLSEESALSQYNNANVYLIYIDNLYYVHAYLSDKRNALNSTYCL